MNFKNFIGALAIAATGMFAMTTASNAAVFSITDGDGDSTLAAGFASTLTLDPTVGVNPADLLFATTSTEFIFVGSNSGTETFNFEIVNSPAVVSFGNLNEPEDFTTAQITVAGQVIDLLANPLPQKFSVAAAGAFTVVTNFVVGSGKSGSFDFTVSAVPLPAGLILLLTGLGGLAFVGRRRQVAAA